MKPLNKSLIKESKSALNINSCKKCGGIIVVSWLTSMTAISKGKRCYCKKPQSKIYTEKELKGFGY
jgi:hypothetical protein